MIDFLCQIEILLLKMLKFQVFPGYFYLNSQIPGFFRFPGKVATLNMSLILSKLNNLLKYCST